ncbi:unnamed protein product [Clavelina lepadiformis]|uniref:Ion transport domain-containing protein n=1 Tax=Clavelina lepadiformis TaxID=159417 RepID=A0ABP0G869_CLALP
MYDKPHSSRRQPSKARLFFKRKYRKWKGNQVLSRTLTLISGVSSMLHARFGEETYIVVNKQDTIFRFNKAKSLCLFGQNNKFRSAAVNMFVTPWFSYFVTFVILVNCICMTLVDPPIWIEDHME